MRIAFTLQDKSWTASIEERFGRTPYIGVYDTVKDQFTVTDNRTVAQNKQGVGPITAQKIYDLQADIVITGNIPGNNAAMVLQKAGIAIYTGATGKTALEAYQAYRNAELNPF